jgi:small subunit ribosomal protein S8
MYHIADFILRIKNAYLARRKEVLMPYSNINKAIGTVLVKNGYLSEIREEEVDGKRTLRAVLRYVRRKPVISDVKVISKPSLRVYVDNNELAKENKKDAMTAILSTSQGVMTGKEAREKGIGGELLFKIW